MRGGETNPGLLGLGRALIGDLRLLLRQQIELARTEGKEMAISTAWGVGLLGAAALLALLGLIFLLVMVVQIIEPHWLGALVLAVLLLAGAAACALVGRSKLRIGKPPKTMATLKENWEWLKTRISAGLN